MKVENNVHSRLGYWRTSWMRASVSSCLLVSGTILGRRYPEWVLYRVVPCPRIVTEPLVDAMWASRFFSAWECRHDFELTPIIHCCFFIDAWRLLSNTFSWSLGEMMVTWCWYLIESSARLLCCGFVGGA